MRNTRCQRFWIPATRFRGDKFTPAEAGAGMTSHRINHDKVIGVPDKSVPWVLLREKSFGQRRKFGQAGGNLRIWSNEQFFSVVTNIECTCALYGRKTLVEQDI
jgi:hypothetical protein